LSKKEEGWQHRVLQKKEDRLITIPRAIKEGRRTLQSDLS